MASVLIDGNPAALRALELATVPGLLTPSHETSQLLLLHGWTESRDITQYAAIPSALDAIAKSRVAQHTLNYKLEMTKLQSLDGAPHASATGVMAPGSPSANPTPTPAGTPAPGDKPAAAKGAKKDQKGAPAPAAPEPVAAVPPKTDKSPEVSAAAIAAYAEERTRHHGVRNLLLGVGNAMQGKQIAVGSVAKAAVKRFRSMHGMRLFLFKATGPVVRPTAALRVVVLVLPGHSLAHLADVLSVVSPHTRGDRVGVIVVVNSGQKKPDAHDVVSVDSPTKVHVEDGEDGPAGDVDLVASASPAEAARQCVALLARHGLSDAGADDAASTVANETFPLVSHLVLEPTSQLPTPTVDEVPAQLIKYVAAFKCDFFALPSASADGATVGDGLVQACLAAPKPHILLLL